MPKHPRKRRKKKQREDKPGLVQEGDAVVSNNKGHENPDIRWIDRPRTMNILTLLILCSYVVLAFISFRQLRLTQQSLRTDERPWVKISSKVKVEGLVEDVPLSAIMEFKNVGKTAAKDVYMEIVMQVTPNGSIPNFGFEGPAVRNTMGAMFPNDPLTLPIAPFTQTGKGQYQPLNLSHHDLEELQAGRAYIMVYAQVFYYDIFGVQHWTRSCGWHSVPPVEGKYTARECTAYNSIDNSQN